MSCRLLNLADSYQILGKEHFGDAVLYILFKYQIL